MTADPFGIQEAQTALEAAVAARDALLVECVLDERWTHDTAAEVFGVSRQRVGQIIARYRAEHAPRKVTPAQRLADAREQYRLALHAQQLRAEQYGMGYREETEAFFGSDKVAQADVSEQRLRWADFLREYQAQTREQVA